MEFCKICGNILLPKKKKSVLFCKVCEKEFPVKDKAKLGRYKKAKKTKKITEKHKALKTAIVEESHTGPAITEDEREAYKELFEGSGE